MDLKDVAGISSASIAKLGKGINVATDVFLKICKALDCEAGNIMEMVKEKRRALCIKIEYTKI